MSFKKDRFTTQQINTGFQNTFNAFRKSTKKPIILVSNKKINQNRCRQVVDIDALGGDIPKFDYIIYFDSDEDACRMAKKAIENRCKFMSLNYCYPTSEYYQINNCARKVLIKSHQEEDRKFNLADYQNIIQAIEITKELDGCYLEVGVMYGTSSNVATNYMEEIGLRRQGYFLDTFEGFKYKEANDSADIRWTNTHVVASSEQHMEMIDKLLKNDHVPYKIIKNNIITDELPEEIDRIVVCNLDVDMYEAVKSGLFKIAPKMVKNGILICEDAGHTPLLLGAFIALQEFLESDLGKQFIPIHMESGQTFLIKK